MTIKDIIQYSKKPELYEKGSSFMWTDHHISKQLLNVHLNPDVDLASRRSSTIKSTAKRIMEMHGGKKLKILDLGCGPGLYTEIFVENGHTVTGVDISENSVKYARDQAKIKRLNISYIHADYLNLDLPENSYDIVCLIYTDIGVLLPEDRKQLLAFVYRILKRGGIFVFDVLKDVKTEAKITPKTWEAADTGFWRARPYITLSDSFLYEEQKVILYQHIVIDAEQADIYRFWAHFFSECDLKDLLTEQLFKSVVFYYDILPDGDVWNGENIIFCKAVK